MYRNVYFQGVQRRPVKQEQNNNYVETPVQRPQYPQFKEISPAVSNAIYSYASPIIRKPYEKMSFDECIISLKQQGKFKGLDFDTAEFPEQDIVELYIKDKKGQTTKSLLFSTDDLEHAESYINYQYKNGREIRNFKYNKNNELEYCSETYYNDEIPQEQFTKEGITAYTKPDEYIEYLKRNTVKFRVEPFEYGDGRETLGITEYDRRNREYQFTGFELNCENRVMREIYERDGSRKRIGFDENATYITEFPQI